jgi:nonribosomal peptide synthetase CepB
VLARLPAPQIRFSYLGRFGAGQLAWPAGLPAAPGVAAAIAVHDVPGGAEMTVTLAWQRHVISDAEARELADGWLAMLGGIAAHSAQPGAGGHTPSDFPLAAVSESEISELEAGWRTRK